MLGWIFRRKSTLAKLEPKALLTETIAYNTRLLEVAEDPRTRQNPLHKSAAMLKPLRPLAAPAPGDSWLGGSPRLPDPFSWPQKDGKPMYFLGQIDCSTLPADIWGGLGPRAGYLAFFVGWGKERIGAAVVHAPSLGPERRAPKPWSHEFFGLQGGSAALPELYERVPAWKLEIATCRAEDRDSEASRRQNPGRWPDVDLTKPEFEPHDWDSLRLLPKLLLNELRKRAEDRRSSLARAETLLANEKPDAEVWKRIAAEAVQLRAAVVEFAAETPYAEDLWRPFAIQAARWRRAVIAEELRATRRLWTGCQRVSDAVRGLFDVCGRELARQRPELGRTLDAIGRRAAAISAREGEIMRLLGGTGWGPSEWHDLYRRHPDVWGRAADEIVELLARVCDAEIELRPVVRGKHSNGNPKPPWGDRTLFQNSFPVSWEEALAFADGYMKTAKNSVAHAEYFETRQREQIVRFTAEVEAAEAKARWFADELAQVEAAASARAFDIREWRSLLARCQGDSEWKRHAHAYDAERYRLAIFAYASAPQSLPAAVRAHFEARWANDRDFEPAFIGGLPEAWSYDMMDGVDKRVMLLELPSSTLLGWQWGDVNDLVISVAVDDLRRNRFRDVSADVTN